MDMETGSKGKENFIRYMTLRLQHLVVKIFLKTTSHDFGHVLSRTSNLILII